ncbi:restriction endonuclease subunit S [Paenibacillus sp. FSL E2-0178]|uniref:restriction endonuclease subunit S n=1 Tax=Paenibacillus sp. FSL E2-0178 TaxID=2921361 RepID=UPI00315881CC
MAGKDKKPDVRFSGLTDAWEQRRVEDLLSEVKRPIRMKDEEEYQLVTVKRRNEGIVSRGFFKGKDILVKSYFKLRSGDYLISKRQVVHGANGIVPKNLDGAIVSNEYLIAFGNKSITSEFLSLISKLPQMYKLFFLSSYGVDIEKLVFDVEDWKKRGITIPSVNEQNKIMLFFNNLDNLISLHQRKYDKLMIVKKSMLEKMFPKHGANVPEIRFSGFINAWERYQLGELGRTQGGIGFPDDEQGGTEGIPFFKISDMNSVGNEHEMVISNNYVNKDQLKRKKWKPIENVPAIIFAKVGAAIMLNRKRLVRTPFLIDNNIMAYIYDESWDTNFGKALFETVNLPLYAQVGALPSYNGSDIERIEVKVPSKDEQELIGEFFRNIENLITLHRRKLEKLKNIKKAMLEKMFV